MGIPYGFRSDDTVLEALVRLRCRGKLEFDPNIGYAAISDSVLTPSTSAKKYEKANMISKEKKRKRLMGL